MSFPDKPAALLGAFFSRFGIGLVIALVQLPTWPGGLIGVVFGFLLSLPSAVSPWSPGEPALPTASMAGEVQVGPDPMVKLRRRATNAPGVSPRITAGVCLLSSPRRG